MRLLVGLVLGTAGLGWGTSCLPFVSGPLCQQLPEGVALFSGTVVDKGTLEQERWSRLAVKAIYQGVPAGTREVIVYPGLLNDFELGESYLLTAKLWRDFGPKPWTWDRLKWWWYSGRHQPSGVRMVSPECSYALEERRVPDEDWAYARAIRDGTHRSRIYGRVSPVFKLWRGGNGLPTIAGATVRIHGKSKMWSVTTDASGSYSVENVEPGQYLVEAEAPGYTSIGPTTRFEVRAIGCGYGPIAMTAAGRIAGRVVRHDGSAAAGARLYYQFAEPKGQGTIKSTTANEKGGFIFDGVPPGNLLLEARPADSHEPYSTMRLQLGLNEVRQGIVFRLAPSPPTRVVSVRVRWPDGRLAAGVEVHGETNGFYSEQRTTGADGIAQLSLLAGHRYSIIAAVRLDDEWAGAGARVEPQTDSVDLVIVKPKAQSR